MAIKKNDDKPVNDSGVGNRMANAVKTGMGNNDNVLKRKNVFLNVSHFEQMEIIAKERGLKTADLIRLAMKEFLERN